MKSFKLCSFEEVVRVCEVGYLIVEVLVMFKFYVVLGVMIEELDDFCYDYIVGMLKCILFNVGYYGYLKMVCILFNYVVCYGILSKDKKLKKGDIVNVDVMLIKDGWFGDSSCMFIVGEVNVLVCWFVMMIYEVLCVGICQVCFGVMLGDVGYVIQKVVYVVGFSVVCEYGGYGIGDVYYDDLYVNYFGCFGEGLKLQEGMIFMIEFMINVGGVGICELNDGWIVVMCDYLLLVQWEYMIVVIKDGFEILMFWFDGLGDYLVIE